MSLLERFDIENKYIPKPSRRRSGILIPRVRFLVAHDTGNPGSSALSNVNWYINTCQTVPKNEVSSAHLFIDDHRIIECVPALNGPAEKAWHVLYKKTKDNELYGANANDVAIGVEYCYGGSIKADAAYERFVWVLAKLCHKFNLNPALDITAHYILDPERKKDPRTGLQASGRTFQQLIHDVVATRLRFNTEMPAANNTISVTLAAGRVQTTGALRLRAQPNTRAIVLSVVPGGTMLDYIQKTNSGELVKGNPTWYKTARGEWFWAGGAVSK